MSIITRFLTDYRFYRQKCRQMLRNSSNQTNNSSNDFLYESVNSSKVNLYGNKAKLKPEQPSGLLFITE